MTSIVLKVPLNPNQPPNLSIMFIYFNDLLFKIILQIISDFTLLYW